MPVQVRRRAVRSRAVRSWAAVLALALGTTACGNTETVLKPSALSGQPAGSIVVPAGGDVPQLVQRLQDAVAADGGAPVVVDHAADARALGIEIPPNTTVIGGPAAATVPLVRADQRAALYLPQRYLVTQNPGGTAVLTTNSADFVAAVSGIAVPDSRTALAGAITATLDQATGTAGPRSAAPLVGVTSANAVLSEFGSADVPVTVERLRRNAARGPSTVVAVLDMAAGSADPGPPVRPTTLVLVSTPEAETPLLAAAPSFGLELPMRFVVWLDEQNRTQIGYPDVVRLAARHGIPAGDPNVSRLAVDADRLARLASGVVQ